jgi:NAD(P)-dependent dehydrogenase (short-subunit alcohol dehydrogenase family)
MELKGAYNASKYATEGLADTWRMELVGTGVEVSLVEPGPIATRFKINAYHKFMENVQYDKGENITKYKKMMERLSGDSRAPFTLDCDATTKAIIHAMGKKPRTRYFVTLPTRLFYYLKKVLPTRALDKLLIMATKKG